MLHLHKHPELVKDWGCGSAELTRLHRSAPLPVIHFTEVRHTQASYIPGLTIPGHPLPASSANQQEEKVGTACPHLFCAVFLR